MKNKKNNKETEEMLEKQIMDLCKKLKKYKKNYFIFTVSRDILDDSQCGVYTFSDEPEFWLLIHHMISKFITTGDFEKAFSGELTDEELEELENEGGDFEDGYPKDDEDDPNDEWKKE